MLVYHTQRWNSNKSKINVDTEEQTYLTISNEAFQVFAEVRYLNKYAWVSWQIIDDIFSYKWIFSANPFKFIWFNLT